MEMQTSDETRVQTFEIAISRFLLPCRGKNGTDHESHRQPEPGGNPESTLQSAARRLGRTAEQMEENRQASEQFFEAARNATSKSGQE